MKLQPWMLALLFLFLVAAQALPLQAQNKGNKTQSPSQPPHTAAQAPAPPAAAQPVPEKAAVITLSGICAHPGAKAGECKTVVTREQFEKLVLALTGGRQKPDEVPPQVRRQFAEQYSRLLTFATEAEKQGLENKPEIQELVRFGRLQALAQGFTQEMQEKAKPTPEQVQKYYNDNAGKFRELTLERVVVPATAEEEEKKPSAEGSKTKPEEKTKPEDMKALAGELHQRATTGADFKTLQAEAFSKAGMPNPPETKLVVEPESIPPSQQAILQLKPGEVTQVLEEPSGYYFYKLDKAEPIPLDRVRGQIENTLTQENMKQEAENLTKKANPDLNSAYFGAAAPTESGAFPPPGARTAPHPPSAPAKPTK